jgi:HSP20 family molecular chaperone IbpA
MTRGQALAVEKELERTSVSLTDARELSEAVQETFDAIARRAYQIFENNGYQHGHDLENWLQAEAELLHPVSLIVEEGERTITVRAEVHGFTASELEVSAEPKRLTIYGRGEARREGKSGRSTDSERRSDKILRCVELPAEIDTNKVTATLQNGILEVVMPRVAAAQRAAAAQTA